MDGSVSLGRGERKRLLEWYRRSRDPAVRLRAHIILLLSEGHAWATIATMLFCSTRTIARWQRRYEQGGLGALRKSGAADGAALPAGLLGSWCSG